MKRLYLLASVAMGSIAVGGCLSTENHSPSGSDSTRPTDVIEHDFETGVGTNAKIGDEPEITVNQDDSTVTVEGVGSYGSSSCGYLTGHDPDYDPETAELYVKVSAEQDRSDDESHCDDAVASSSYRFLIRFDEGVPARIAAEHPFEQKATKEPQ